MSINLLYMVEDIPRINDIIKTIQLFLNGFDIRSLFNRVERNERAALSTTFKFIRVGVQKNTCYTSLWPPVTQFHITPLRSADVSLRALFTGEHSRPVSPRPELDAERTLSQTYNRQKGLSLAIHLFASGINQHHRFNYIPYCGNPPVAAVYFLPRARGIVCYIICCRGNYTASVVQ
jgi:hypothetical protein